MTAIRDASAADIVVVGLGYVGLPLAVRLSRDFPVRGFDTDSARIAELRQGHDRTREIEPAPLLAAQAGGSLTLVEDAAACRGAEVYIVTVPTPVGPDNRPDLTLVERACASVGAMLDPAARPIVVFESTVYPGVTEDVCGPILARVSGLERGRDFFLGYSPERINPGDREHTVDRITKVVAGENPEVTDRLCAIYGKVTSGGVFPAASIRVAEAAKVIENAQRDINIAFVNEVAQITRKLGISIWDVLDAAKTKWNFLPFQPGMVGGHCIGVDPYYLSHCAQGLGHDPQVILAGRSINDGMAAWLAGELDRALAPASKVLVLGLAFKENVPDLRNSKVADLVAVLAGRGHSVAVHDPLVDRDEARHEYGLELLPDLPREPHDAVIMAVPHAIFTALPEARLVALLHEGGLFADIKNAFPALDAVPGIRRWRI
ncbi:nucleotide sugar dehydrogenase [Erythrobacter colymbi]|uniref:nucleotide sugar dehydrogenase n=1 Tax=Erythrobacter colymbi TaxID=1161202 RepID=UPI001F0B52BB|nr:nucleotide sugar dehydrogenase [Erythrobacter colymbi]